MSFLNPVNEPVKRFSSTDAGAPQINYNARVAGDVKTVLKACLVTGYGDKASAGWSIANEVDHVAEFVSPSVAMSDYRLGIDDTSTSSTTWYYRYQNERVNPTGNIPSKSISNINKTSSSNSWQLLATERGIFLIETFLGTLASALSSRVTYIGQNKAAVNTLGAANISFFNEGFQGSDYAYNFFTSSKHYRIGSYSFDHFFSSIPFNVKSTTDYTVDVSNIDLSSPLYMATSDNIILGQQVGMLFTVINDSASMFGVSDEVIYGRPVLKLCLGYHGSSASSIYTRSRNVMIYLDYWEY